MAQQTRVDDQTYMKQYGDQLSDTTRRAKWIASTNEHEDHDGQTLATRSHEVIQQWAQERDAQPATIAGTGPGDRPGVLRFDFPGYDEGGRIEQISWDAWFDSFDQRELVFDYQEKLKSGKQSNFFQLDNPRRERG